MCRLVEIKVLFCPKRISENDCTLCQVIIFGYLKRDWCVSLCCKRMFHMLWHSSYLQMLLIDMNLYMEIVALYRVYTDLIATATILLRSWCQKGEKWVKNTNYIQMSYFLRCVIWILCHCIFCWQNEWTEEYKWYTKVTDDL